MAGLGGYITVGGGGAGGVTNLIISSGGLSSGAVTSGFIGNAAVVSGSFASGQIGRFALASGAINSGQISSGAVTGSDFGGAFTIASGTIGTFDVGSGQITFVLMASGSVLSGSIASGQIGSFAIASGGVLSGNIASGQIGQFAIASGAVTSGNIASGAVGQFAHSSGAINSGQIGNNAVVSGSIASGQIGQFALSSGAVNSGQIGNNAVVSGSIASGQIGQFALSSGAINSGQIGNNAVVSGSIASGSVGMNALASGVAGSINSGQNILGRVQYLGPYFSGSALATIIAEEFVSGPCAVVISPSGNIRTAMASLSGRMPAMGFVWDNVPSGVQANVYTDGFFQFPSGHTQLGQFSGYGQLVFVGRSGAIVNQSGGLNSGGLLSGDVTQSVGYSVNSGGITVNINPGLPTVLGLITSGNIASGQVGAPHLSAVAVLSGHVGSGAIEGANSSGAMNIASGTIGNNDIGSGVIGLSGAQHFTSGALIANSKFLQVFVDFSGFIAGEPISGVRAVCWLPTGTNRSGLIIAMAAVSGRMPAVGVMFGNVGSGSLISTSGSLNALYTQGTFQMPSGNLFPIDPSQRLVYVGRSGQLVTWSGVWNSGGWMSGDLLQPLGFVVNGSGLVLNVSPVVQYAQSGIFLF